MEAWVSGFLRQEICEQFRKFDTLVSCICFCSNSSILLFLRWASLSSNICRWRNLFRVRLIRKEKGEKNNNKKRSIITCVNWHARGVGKILAHTWQGLRRTLSDCQNYEKCDTKTKTFDMKLLWGDNSWQNLEYETYARLFENRRWKWHNRTEAKCVRIQLKHEWKLVRRGWWGNPYLLSSAARFFSCSCMIFSLSSSDIATWLIIKSL